MDNKDIKKEAIKYFNKSWDYIDKDNRNKEDDLIMIDYAYKSKYYWSLVGNEVNFVRSDWQISRVFAEANLLEAALYYADQCLKETLRLELKGFDLFFAYESKVRVYSLMKMEDEMTKFSKLALNSVETIAKKDDKEYCLSELNKILSK